MLIFLRSVWADRRAIALIEFALAFPVLFFLLFGGIEVARNILITLKVEKAGYVLTDIVSQYDQATGTRAAGEINAAVFTNEVFPQFTRVMGTYAGEAKQNIIFTAVRRDAGGLKLKWQISGGGSLLDETVKSVVNGKSPAEINAAVMGDAANFDGDAEAQAILSTVAPGETFIVGEVFYHYTPILRDILHGITQIFGPIHGFYLDERTIVKRMYIRPRSGKFGEFVCLPPHYLYPECQLVSAPAAGSCAYRESQHITECSSKLATGRDYYKCNDDTFRYKSYATAPLLAGCGSFTYGKAIQQDSSRSFLNGSTY